MTELIMTVHSFFITLKSVLLVGILSGCLFTVSLANKERFFKTINALKAVLYAYLTSKQLKSAPETWIYSPSAWG